jgi:hypothetical protein
LAKKSGKQESRKFAWLPVSCVASWLPDFFSFCLPCERIQPGKTGLSLLPLRVIRRKVRLAYMEKPNVRGPSPSRKAHLALQQKLNRPKKPPPLLRTPINSRGRKRHR